MASTLGRTRSALIDQVFAEGDRFEFFQAVRLLSRHHRQQARIDPAHIRQEVGHDGPPTREDVRFRSPPSFAFPATEISKVKPGESIASGPDTFATGSGTANRPAEMTVAFLGLTGPQGVLPDHYTRQICERLREGDTTLHEFLDLFHHRLVSLFYRAWEKYSIAAAYESAQTSAAPEGDQFTQTLHGLVGLQSLQARSQLELDEQSLLFYAGHFADPARTASGLEQMLTDYFEMPIRVEQFQGSWLTLNEDDLSRLPSGENPSGLFCRLGENLVAGRRVWDVRSRFRLRLGPLNCEQFLSFLPDGRANRSLVELTRLYVGSDLDFDIQPELLAADVPPLRLNAEGDHAPRLGWNTWLQSSPRSANATDVLFSI